MNEYIITTDSGSDLSESLYKKYDVIPIMMEYEVDGNIYFDTPDEQKIKEFYNLHDIDSSKSIDEGLKQWNQLYNNIK